MNVLPLVNKALTIYQWQQDIATAERLLKEALEIDPETDSAVATLAQLTLQQGKLPEAIELFTRHANIARTEAELEQALTFKFVRGVFARVAVILRFILDLRLPRLNKIS